MADSRAARIAFRVIFPRSPSCNSTKRRPDGRRFAFDACSTENKKAPTFQSRLPVLYRHYH